MFIHIKTFVTYNPWIVIDPLGVIEDAPITNASVIMDLTQCGKTKYIIFVLL